MISITNRQGLFFLLLAALLLAAPGDSHAQFSGLANMAKGKALEVLNDKVMEELEKKFAEAVAKEPISETAKAATVKKLSEIAKPVVKRFIDGAASGKLPNPAELVQTVLKDILPRVPEIVAASRTAEGGGAAEAGNQAYAAGSGQAAQGANPAQAAPQVRETPKIAIYVFGAEAPALNKAMATRLITALANTGRYQAVENYKEFFEQAEKERVDSAAAMSSEQFERLGWQFGVQYICIAEITTVLGESQISARVVEVATGNVAAIGVAESPLKVLTDVAEASERIVETMFKNAPAPAVVYAPPPPPPTPAVAATAAPEPGQRDGYTDQDLRAAPAPVEPELPPYHDFSGSARFWTCYLNTMAPGLGSGAIMRDWNGLGVQIGLTALGWGLYGLGYAVNNRDLSNIFVYVGYTALATNFTYNIVRSATYKRPYDATLQPRIRRCDYYFAPKYQLPIGTPVPWGGVNLEWGVIWGGGAFLGMDANFDADYFGDGRHLQQIGGGLSVGGAYDFGGQFQAAYGGSAGYWSVKNLASREYTESSYDSYYGIIRERKYTERTKTESANFIAPFVKARWRFVELTYRGLLGTYEKETVSRYADGSYKSPASYDRSFGWNGHQLMLGFYLATSKRDALRER